MRLLQINKLYHPVIGGVETVVQNIAEGLTEKDIQVDILACQIKGPRIEELINKIKVYRAASFGKKLGMPLSLDFFSLFFKIYKKYDKIIIHYPFPLATLICPFIPKNKLIIYYHSDIVRQKILGKLLSPIIRYSLKRADKILVASHNLTKSSPDLKKFNNKCQVIPFGLKIEISDQDLVDAKKIKQQYSQKYLLLAIGRLVYYKGFSVAIEAMNKVNNARLLIIGSGPNKNKLENLIKINNLENKVTIIPFQDKLMTFFLAADIFIFPSIARSEAFGLVQLEAMAAGKPIINTYLQTGVEEVSPNNISGLTVGPNNSELLSQAINKLIENDDLRLNLGNQAKKRYQEKYTLEKFIDNLIKIIN